MGRPTIKDIATQLGVSHSTVSRALRGDTRISKTTAERVRQAASEAGYRPNIMACGLVHNRSSLIGIVTSNVRGSFFPDVIDGAQAVLERRRYSILLACSNKSTQAERNHLEILIDKHVEGMIVLPVTSCGTNSRAMRQAQRLHIPIVIVGTSKSQLEAPSVCSDNEKGGFLATQHLLELGHQRIVYLTHSLDDLHSKQHRYGLENLQRYRGYVRAMSESGNGSSVTAYELDAESGDMNPLRARMSGKNAPTALFAYSDTLAVATLQAALKWGVSIPEDLSIVGFDDVDFAARTFPALTTIAQPKIDMGRFAAKKILNLIEDLPEDSLVCAPELRLRDSTASPRRKLKVR